MRTFLIACLATTALTACSNGGEQSAETSSDVTQDPVVAPVSTPVPERSLMRYAMVETLIAKTGASAPGQLGDMIDACRSADAFDTATQDDFILINARPNDDQTLLITVGKWTESDAVYRDFTVRPDGSSIAATETGLAIHGDYQSVNAMGYVLDSTGEITFAGPPPVEFPIPIACDIPADAVDALTASFGDAFTYTGPTLEDNYREQISYFEEDTRFEEVLLSCGAETVTDPKLISFGFVDSPTQAYQNHIFATTATTYEDSIELLTMFLPLGGFSVIQGEDRLTLRANGETASGVTQTITPGSGYNESFDFQEMEERTAFACQDPFTAAAVINGVRNWAGQGRKAAKPLRYSVALDHQDFTCALSPAALSQEIAQTAWGMGLEPILDLQNPDLVITATAVAQNADSKTGCEYDALLSGNFLEEDIRPLPARNQNYEVGTEVISQGFIQAGVAFRDID